MHVTWTEGKLGSFAGVRGFEFNTLADPQGGNHAYSAAVKLTGAAHPRKP